MPRGVALEKFSIRLGKSKRRSSFFKFVSFFVVITIEEKIETGTFLFARNTFFFNILKS